MSGLWWLAAFEIGKTWRPHVIVMDILMPEFTGFDAARALRHDRLTSGIVVIAFSTLEQNEVRGHLVDYEFDGYCQKGVPPTRLFALIRQFAG